MAQTVNPWADYLLKTGTGVNANDILFTFPNTMRFNTFEVMTTAGNVFVEVSLDGTNFTTVPMSLIDQGSTTPATQVTATAATGRMYQLYGKYMVVRVKQSGATASAASMLAAVS